MRSCLAVLLACGSLSWSAAGAAIAPSPEVAPTTDSRLAQESLDRLNSMFSPEIQAAVAACWEQGKVDLAAGPSAQGWVICGDGSVAEGIGYDAYLTIVENVMVASTLAGMRTAMAQEPRLTPETLAVFVTTTEGRQMMQSIVQSAILESGLQMADRPASAQILTDRVATALIANLSDPDRLNTILGPTDQYGQVVEQFCTAPGMSINEALQTFPQHDSVQLFSVCIQESGLVND